MTEETICGLYQRSIGRDSVFFNKRKGTIEECSTPLWPNQLERHDMKFREKYNLTHSQMRKIIRIYETELDPILPTWDNPIVIGVMQ